jgi:hypothetical protein
MAARRSPTALLATLGFATLGVATTPATARADEPTSSPQPIRAQAAEILAGLDLPEDEQGWLAFHLDRMGIHKKYGLTYSQRLDAGDKGMSFSVRGPVLGKALSKRRRFGLSFEIHF